MGRPVLVCTKRKVIKMKMKMKMKMEMEMEMIIMINYEN